MDVEIDVLPVGCGQLGVYRIGESGGRVGGQFSGIQQSPVQPDRQRGIERSPLLHPGDPEGHGLGPRFLYRQLPRFLPRGFFFPDLYFRQPHANHVTAFIAIVSFLVRFGRWRAIRCVQYAVVGNLIEGSYLRQRIKQPFPVRFGRRHQVDLARGGSGACADEQARNDRAQQQAEPRSRRRETV